MSLTPKLLQQGAAGSARPVYIEDVFSTYLYTGTGASQTITNGIDLAGKGGLVWTKFRSGNIGTASHALTDTTRGVNKYLSSNSLNAETSSWTDTLTAFNANGYTLGADAVTSLFNYYTATNYYTSWTFRKQPKFFDVVTYNGNSTASRQISHNLGSTPGCIIIKSTTGGTAGYPWIVWHRSLSTNTYLQLNTTDSELSSSAYVAAVSSTTFTINSSQAANLTGDSYVAYLFAHNAGGFGLTGNDNVISCGSFTASASITNINLGYEPQWLLIKRTDGVGNWQITDNMRTWCDPKSNLTLYPNLTNAETNPNSTAPSAVGFSWESTVGQSWIYIAIRRGPMKVPTTGTSVFKPVLYTGDSTTDLSKKVTAGFPVDLSINFNRNGVGGSSRQFFDRLRGRFGLQPSSSSTESDGGATQITFDSNSQVSIAYDNINYPNNYVDYLFRRAPGFFDIVCYTGTGSATTQTHNLGVAPELMIVKTRSNAEDWNVYSKTLGNTVKVVLNGSGTPSSSSPDWWNNTTPTSSVFTVGSAYETNRSGYTYVAYLFASCPGVSKVGSYTGNGSTQTIECGFAAGARFVLIKRTDVSADWHMFDSARGIIAGNDPFSFLNGTAVETTSYDAIDPDNSGFIVNNDATNYPINVASATYIFLAIA